MADLFRDTRLGYFDHAVAVDFASPITGVGFALSAGETMIRITGAVLGSAAPTIILGVVLNSDLGTNYDNQLIEAEGAAATAIRTTGDQFGRLSGLVLPEGRKAQYDLLITKPLANQPALVISRVSGFEDTPSSRRIYAEWATIWRNSVDALTTVAVIGSIDVGSFIQVERNLP